MYNDRSVIFVYNYFLIIMKQVSHEWKKRNTTPRKQIFDSRKQLNSSFKKQKMSIKFYQQSIF